MMDGTADAIATQEDWWIVFDVLREAKNQLDKEGLRASWMDGALAIAKEHANV